MLVTVPDILSVYTAMDGITVIPPLDDDNAEDDKIGCAGLAAFGLF